MSNVVPLHARTRITYRRLVPPVPAELLTEAAERLVCVQEEHGEDKNDIMMCTSMMIRERRGTKSLDELAELSINLSARLTALHQHFASQAYRRNDAYAVLHGKDPRMLRAAARAPLNQAEYSCDYRFELGPFLQIMQEEGRATAGAGPADS